MNTTNHARIPYLDTLRILAMLGVIVIHLAATGYSQAPPGSFSWAVCLAYCILSRFAVPVFVMISGSIYLNPKHPVAGNTMLRKAGRILAIFLFWSLLYGLAESITEPSGFSGLAHRILQGHYHMWYLKLIVLLYLLVPFLRSVKEMRLRILTFAALSLGFWANLFPNAPILWSYVAYLGYFCLGYLLSKKDIDLKTSSLNFGLSILLLALSSTACIYWGRPELSFRESMPHIGLYSIAIFLLVKSRPWRSPSASLISCQFGIYLVHPAVNFLLRQAGLYALTFSPLLAIPLCMLLVACISFTAVWVMKHIPLLRHLV